MLADPELNIEDPQLLLVGVVTTYFDWCSPTNNNFASRGLVLDKTSYSHKYLLIEYPAYRANLPFIFLHAILIDDTFVF